jgi:arsenate reductase (thioredoxin)
MTRVLFICIHNSARSQMAEAYLRRLGGSAFEAESAGIEPGTLNPRVVRALREDGIDISGKPTRGVFDLVKTGRSFDYVVAVCSKEAADRCPVFPGRAVRLQWSFDDPSTFTGSDEEIMARIRRVRDGIRDTVAGFIQSMTSAPDVS